MLTCTHCNYSTNRNYNLQRHINTKHNSIHNNTNTYISSEKTSGEKVILGGEKVILGGEKVILGGEKVILGGEKVILEEEARTLRCAECYKTFARYRNLVQHKNSCKKVKQVNECSICHKIFAYNSGLCKHKKICSATALVPYSSQETPAAPDTSTDNEPQNLVIQNNTVNNNNQNTVNNHTQNINSHNNVKIENHINIFPTSLHTDYTINTSHFTLQDLRRSIRNQSTFEAIGTSLRMVLEDTNNLPVKKKNLRSGNSYVHVGNNKWEIRKDKEVFGLISFHISRCIQVYLQGANLTQLQQFYREATEALEYVASNNIQYLERESIQMAKRIMDILLLSAYERPEQKETIIATTPDTLCTRKD